MLFSKASSRYWLAVLALLMALALGACNFPSPTPTPEPSPTAPPTCTPAQLQRPTNGAPANWEVVTNTLTPTLSWDYPGSGCVPEAYEIEMRTGPFFSATDAVTITISGTQTSVDWPYTLDPATEYAWAVRPMSGGTRGLSGGFYKFLTGPMCGGASALVAPVLVAPPDGATYDDIHDDGLMWEYPEPCLPTGYRIDVSPSPDFSDTSLSGGTGNPSTVWGVGHPMESCQVYYWRVAAMIDGTSGPWSEVRSFVTPSGATSEDCSPATIQGVVWHDLCATPADNTSPLPEGCVEESDGSIHADGIRQADEPGIEGVEVALHANACSSPVVAVAVTDANGAYTFDNITAMGHYCVSVTAADPVNTAILVPGTWTYPEGFLDTDPATTDVITAVGETSTADFGWDYQFLPIPPMSGGNSPFFHLTKNAFCREGPGKAYPKVATLTAGTEVPVEGRLANNSWLYVYWKPYDVHCWVATYLGEASGIEDIVVLTPPPPPPTATPSDTTPPTISDVHALERILHYASTASTSCSNTTLHVAARVSDDGGITQNNIQLVYRLVPDSGSAGAWQTAPVHDAAMGGQFGFWVEMNTKEVYAFMQRHNGHVEFYVRAVDNVGNAAQSATQSVPLQYCNR